MLLFSIALTGAVFLGSGQILSALGASDKLLVLGKEYIKVIAFGTVLQIFGTGLVPFMRNYGGSLGAMVAMIWWSAVIAKVITAVISIVLSVRYSTKRK